MVETTLPSDAIQKALIKVVEDESMDERGGAENLKVAMTEACGEGVDVSDYLELAARSVLVELVGRGKKDQVKKLIGITIALAQLENDSIKHLAPIFGRVPYQIFENLIESSSIVDAEEWWSEIENRKKQLTWPPLFARGKFYTLRFCNGLLRRLSRTRDAQLCGRILMFLAFAFPISERSAVNIKGEVHSELTTVFEDADTFNAKDFIKFADDDLVQFTSNHSNKMDDDDDENMEDVQDKGNDDEEDDEEGRRPSKKKKIAVCTKMTSTQQKKFTGIEQSYEEYHSLWAVQRWLADPTLALSNDTERESMFKAIEKTLTTFEATPFNDADKNRLETVWRNQEARVKPIWEASNPPPKYVPVGDQVPKLVNMEDVQIEQITSGPFAFDSPTWTAKYLTDSRLLRVQLRDPILRMQILTQMFIILEYYIYLKCADDETETWRSRCTRFRQRVLTAIRSTPPHGKKHALFCEELVRREKFWLKWKKDGCPSFERFPEAQKPKVKRKRSPWEVPNLALIRKLDEQREAKREPNLLEEAPDIHALVQVLADQCSTLYEQVPSLESHLAAWTEADDPENGIEEEYHPKKNQMWRFQAIRLVAQHHSAWLEDMPLGQIEPAVARLTASSSSSNNKIEEDTMVDDKNKAENNDISAKTSHTATKKTDDEYLAALGIVPTQGFKYIDLQKQIERKHSSQGENTSFVKSTENTSKPNSNSQHGGPAAARRLRSDSEHSPIQEPSRKRLRSDPIERSKDPPRSRQSVKDEPPPKIRDTKTSGGRGVSRAAESNMRVDERDRDRDRLGKIGSDRDQPPPMPRSSARRAAYKSDIDRNTSHTQLSRSLAPPNNDRDRRPPPIDDRRGPPPLDRNDRKGGNDHRGGRYDNKRSSGPRHDPHRR